MSKPIGVSLNDYIKVVEICIAEKYGDIKHHANKGSVYTFEVFEKRPLSVVKMELAKTGKYSEKFIESVISGLSKSAVYED